MTVRFYSPALHRQADYLVYVPTHYNPARRYPVLYLLHGTPGRPQNFINIVDIDVRLDTLISRARVVPMVLVFPDGRVNGSMFSDSEWANAGHGNYESYVLDVMHDVDHRFPTQPARTARVLAGYSEGGFGATNIGLHHLDSFAGIESWSGYFVENRFGLRRRTWSTFGAPPAARLLLRRHTGP
jgi:enterochelin esterase-like enzyme